MARLFYMVQGINPMTDSTKPRTLKDQLESETAETERSAAVDSERYHPGRIELELIEVQTGSYLGEDDIVRLQDVYNRG